MENQFIKAAIKATNVAETENGALSYRTTGSVLIDQFGKAGTAHGRNIKDVWNDQAQLWAENPEYALKFPFYLRMITRKTREYGGDSTETVQRGQGARDEAFKRLLWIAEFHSEDFYKNLWLLPVVGSWKDLWTLMTMSERLDHGKFFTTIAEGINDDYFKDLVKKYMPRIRSSKSCKTDWAKKTNALAKEFCKYVGWTYESYRKFKSTGKAHEFQQIICKGLYNKIRWSRIPGKALANLVSGEFITRHNLEDDYSNWLGKQDVINFNGYPFELGTAANNADTYVKKLTVNKQFNRLIRTASEDNGALKGNILCALDTSGSMRTWIGYKDVTAYDVCVSLGIYFAKLNKGAFHNVVAMFDDKSTLMELHGQFTDKWEAIRESETAWGSTSFESLIQLLCEIRLNNELMPISDFPTTLLVISDMQFNPVSTSEGGGTNYEWAKWTLSKCFPKEYVDNFKIVWWYCTSRETADVPSTMDDAGTYLISGFDGSVMSLLLGCEEKVNEKGEVEKPSMEDLVKTALNQEILQKVELA